MAWWSTVDQSTPWLYRGGFALHACCAAIVIAAVRIDGPLARWLMPIALGAQPAPPRIFPHYTRN